MDGGKAVAEAINNRMEELGMTQAQLSKKSDVSLATLREIQHNAAGRRRRPQTLADISKALGWPPDHLHKISRGGVVPRGTGHRDSGGASVRADDDVAEQIEALKTDIRAIRQRLDEQDEVQELRRQHGRLEALLMDLYSRTGQAFPHERLEEKPTPREAAA